MISGSKDTAMQQHLLNCKDSGLSQKAYCQQHQIPSHIFYCYKNKLSHKVKKNTSGQDYSGSGNQRILVNLTVTLTKPVQPITIKHNNGFSLDVIVFF